MTETESAQCVSLLCPPKSKKGGKIPRKVGNTNSVNVSLMIEQSNLWKLTCFTKNKNKIIIIFSVMTSEFVCTGDFGHGYYKYKITQSVLVHL